MLWVMLKEPFSCTTENYCVCGTNKSSFISDRCLLVTFSEPVLGQYIHFTIRYSRWCRLACKTDLTLTEHPHNLHSLWRESATHIIIHDCGFQVSWGVPSNLYIIMSFLFMSFFVLYQGNYPLLWNHLAEVSLYLSHLLSFKFQSQWFA